MLLADKHAIHVTEPGLSRLPHMRSLSTTSAHRGATADRPDRRVSPTISDVILDLWPWSDSKSQVMKERDSSVGPIQVNHLGGRPSAGRIGAITLSGQRRGPDHIAGTASTAYATA